MSQPQFQARHQGYHTLADGSIPVQKATLTLLRREYAEAFFEVAVERMFQRWSREDEQRIAEAEVRKLEAMDAV